MAKFEPNDWAAQIFSNTGVLEFSENKTKYLDEKLAYHKKWLYTSVVLSIVISTIALGVLVWITKSDLNKENLTILKDMG